MKPCLKCRQIFPQCVLQGDAARAMPLAAMCVHRNADWYCMTGCIPGVCSTGFRPHEDCADTGVDAYAAIACNNLVVLTSDHLVVASNPDTPFFKYRFDV